MQHPIDLDYRQLFENMSEGLAVHEMIYDEAGSPSDYRILDVNPQYEAIVNIPKKKAIGALASEVYKKDAFKHLAIYERVVKSGKPDKFEYYFDSLQKYLSVNVFSPGEGRFVTVFTDVTGNKQVDGALKQSEEQLRTLINATPDIVCFKDGKGRWLQANNSDLELFCLTDAPYHGKTDSELAEYTHPIFRDAFYQCEKSDERAWLNEELFQEEETIKRPDGTVKVYDVIKVPVFNDDGSRKGLVVLGRDITERKQAEQAMQLSKESFENVFNNSSVAIYIQDQNGRFLDVNQAAADMHGFEKQELIGNTPEIMSAPGKNDDAQLRDYIRQTFMGYPQQFEYWARRKNGEIFPKLVYTEKGRHFGRDVVFAYAIETTARKRAELIQQIQYNIARAVVTDDNLAKFYETIRSELSQIINTRNFIIALYDDQKNMLYSPFENKDVKDKIPQYWSAENSLTGYTIRQKQTVLVKKEEIYQLEKDGVIDLIGTVPEVWFGLPLQRDNKVIGALVLQDYESPDAYDTPKKEIIEMITHQLSIFIENKRKEEEVYESRQKFRSLVENSMHGILMIDMNRRITYTNQSVTEIFGYEEHELLGHDFTEFTDTESMNLVIDRHQKRKQGYDVPSRYTFDIVNKQGNTRRVEVSAAMTQDNTGQANTIVHLVDITDRLQKQKLQQVLFEISKMSYGEIGIKSFMHKTHQYLKEIMKADNFYVALYDAATNMYTFPYHVDEFEDAQTDKPVALPDSLTDYVRKERQGKLINDDDEVQLMKAEGLKPAGVPSPVWMGAPLMNSDDDEVIGVIAVQDYHDRNVYNHQDLVLLEIMANNIGLFIERIRNIESLRKAKQKAEESEQLKSAFLLNISHEIRTPMNGILGFADLLQDPKLEGKEQQHYIDVILRSGNRMLNIINDLIDISKVEAGQEKVSNESISVNTVMDEMYTFFCPEAEKSGLKLTYTKALKDEESKADTDRTKLVQVLSNLIKNALKYTNEGRINFGYNVKGKDLEFYVTDTGIGIPHELQQKMFERFRQAELSVARDYEGAGLGLSLCKAYVEMLGGRINVESTPGKGSTFYFTLPFESKRDDEKKPVKKDVADFAVPEGKKILMAEDDDASYMLLEAMLKRKSTLIRVYDGKQAVEEVTKNPELDLVIMDIKMPEMDGYEATHKIKEIAPNLPVIAQTAYATDGEKEKSRAAGCDAYIAKPLNRQRLFKLMHDLMNKGKVSG